eukprot:CAMPEP_0183327902 /NCGR_PEP_ID=MMETSP0160_2-20130417/84003_1 /TAXON_ID=2839 ORGANISM="Odontella Sinensis, Strain Grunow 1884" /NCGR_SAMPLE_ID=MMETSP0160_2 /ASSEMBLY_ACC=CAM_ASM_000250 /LENGTH=611 /DNA_ID=CAMNT_0025496047 /DNA_START=360 /DNA_END=2190 /DNA_ORIENTATION=+
MKLAAAVRDEAVALHLTHAKSSITGSPLQGLAGEHCHRTTGTGVHLVIHQVLESLVECRANEDSGVQGTSCVSLVHGLIPMALVSHGVKAHTDVLDCDICERGGIPLAALEDNNLAQEALDELGDGHTGGDGVGVDDDVWNNALGGERHVLLAVSHSNGTLLPMPRGEFVADLRDPNIPNPNLREPVPLLRRADQDVVHDPVLVRLHRGAAVPLGEAARHPGSRVQGRRLADEYVVAGHPRPGLNQPVVVELAVLAVLHSAARVEAGLLERLGREGVDGPDAAGLLLVDVAPVVGGAEEAAVDGRLVHDEGVLLVVARVDHDGDAAVDAGRELPEVQELHGAGGAQGLLGVVQDVGHGVHPHLVVGGVDAHRLLSHRGLVRVSGTLVVIREGYDRGAYAQYHGGVDLAVRVRGRVRLVAPQVLRLHGDHGGLLLLGVDVLHQPLHQEVGPRQLLLVRRGALQLHDVPLLDDEALVLHHEEGSADAPGVGVDAHLGLCDVPDDADLRVDVDHAAEGAEGVDQGLGIAVDSDPVAVDEDLARGGLGDHGGEDVGQVLGAEFLEELHDGDLGGAGGDVGHEGEVFDEADGLSLRGFGRADHAPVGVVKLTRLRL